MEEKQFWNYMELLKVNPAQLDALLADGWRHFGTFFFRDTLSWNGDTLSTIIPLRINLAKFYLSKSQRKLLRRTQKSQVIFRDAFIDAEKEAIFHKHCQRFKSNVPNSLCDFLHPQPAFVPCHTMECCLYDEQGRLYAVSFLDVAQQSTSSIYAMFDPEYSPLSPGLHTLLEEIRFAQSLQKQYLYTGYAFWESSNYDYKKKFAGTEYYDWQGQWQELDNAPPPLYEMEEE
ncbi:MAG: hypothetical protein OHK0053_03910 [Microscillaceae bacterium]